MNCNYLTTIWESIFAQMYKFLVEQYIFYNFCLKLFQGQRQKIEKIQEIHILKAIKNATGISVIFPINISLIHVGLVLTNVPNVGECFTKT